MRDFDDDSTRPEAVIGPIGRRRFIQGVGAAAGAAAIGAVLPEGVAKAAPAGASQFIPLPVAVRVVDTRDPGRYVFIRHWDNHISVPIAAPSDRRARDRLVGRRSDLRAGRPAARGAVSGIAGTGARPGR